MNNDPMVGGDILRLVTAGLYGNPLELYREYLQNAADAIASMDAIEGAVVVNIDPLEARITITDNGTGLSPSDARSRLMSIGNSTKSPAVDRGLRGIGRLSGLAFAEGVHFTTRACASEPVTRVSWSSSALREPELMRVDAATAIKACTTVQSLDADDWPGRFFEVRIDGIARHAASALLNQDAVRRYIGEVCSVPLSCSFPFAAEVGDFIAEYEHYFTLDVTVEGMQGPIERPFGATIPLTESYAAPFERLEKRVIPAVDGDAPAAILWLADTPYAGSIPRSLGVRGLRARVGNMQIGADDVFSDLFLEARFSGWCVGEVHIVDSRIVPNARRDYFEPGHHLRNLENHIGAVAQEISARCRAASSHRNKIRGLGVKLDQIKSARDLAASGYLPREDADALLAYIRDVMPQVLQTLDELNVSPSQFGHENDQFTFCEGRDESGGSSEPRVLKGLPASTVDALRSAFGAVSRTMPPDSALDVIESIIRRVSKRKPLES